MIRPATHAGSWYTGNKASLTREIKDWIDNAKSAASKTRYALGPHAGYAYCGQVLASTYASLDPSVNRVFVMGPSHCEYFRGFRTTEFDEYATPVGNVRIDTKAVKELAASGVKFLSQETDLREHGIEMHLPFLKSVAPQAEVVPLVFGDCDSKADKLAFSVLGKYFDDPKTAFVVSSDFCHWGRSFGYTLYGSPGLEDLAPVRSSRISRPIWESIRELDLLGMKIASKGSAEEWNEYIEATGNTVCGQKPLGVLLGTANALGKKLEFQWLAYDQSSKVTSPSQTSVSYASGVASVAA